MNRLLLADYFTSGTWLSDVADIASLIGFVMTLWIWFSLKALREKLLFKARFPQLKKALEKHASAISENMREYPTSKPQIEEELDSCLTVLKNLRPKLSGTHKRDTKTMITRIEKQRVSLTVNSKNEIRITYRELQMLIENLRQHTEDMKWSEE